MRIAKDQEKRLQDLAASSIVGGDIKAVLAEVRELRSLEQSYTHQLGEMARLCDVVCSYVIANASQMHRAGVVPAAHAIMEYVEAVRPAKGSPAPKWVMHILGPDDVINCISQFDALRKSNDHNKAYAKLVSDDPRPNDPYCVAVAEVI